MSNMMNLNDESVFLADPDLRASMIEHVEVLEKVRTLLLVPAFNMVHISHVASFFDVDLSTIQRCFQRNRAEIESDGVTLMSALSFLNEQFVHLEKKEAGRYLFTMPTGETLALSNRPSTFFSANAVLRIAMLLGSNNVAQEVRTQLIHLVRNISPQERVVHLNREKELALDVMFAPDPASRAMAMGEYNTFQLEIRTALEAKIEALAQSNAALNQENEAYSIDEMLWDDRTIVGKLVKSYGARAYPNCNATKQVCFAWSQFYRELSNSYGIALDKRKEASARKCAYKNGLLDYVRPEEWVLLVRKAFAMCRQIGCHLRQSLENDVVYARILHCAAITAKDLPSANLEEPLGLPESVYQ